MPHKNNKTIFIYIYKWNSYCIYYWLCIFIIQIQHIVVKSVIQLIEYYPVIVQLTLWNHVDLHIGLFHTSESKGVKNDAAIH